MSGMAGRVPSVSAAALPALPLALVLALGAVQGGFGPDTWVWATPLAAWAAALAALLAGCGGLRHGRVWTGAALGLLAWTAASAAWSAAPSQSWLEARRTVLYATVVLALLALARRGAAGALTASTHAGISLLLVYALARYLLAPRHLDRFESGFLFEPLGYANAVGILAALGLLLGTGLAARSGGRARMLATATLPPLALSLSLTGSRGALGALAAGILVLAALEPPAALLRVVLAAGPGAAAAVGVAAALHLDAGSHVPSRAAGAGVAAVTALAAAAAALGAGAEPRTAGPVRRRVSVVLVAAGIAVGVAAVALAGATEPRGSYWSVAWHDQAASHPFLGTGAGTFGRAWVASGGAGTAGGALDAHSLYLETLAELGPLGLVLLVLFLGAPLAAAVLRADARVAPAASAYAAFLVHAGLDWDWELPAVVVAVLACGAALVLGDEPLLEPLRPRARAALLAAALCLGGAGVAGARSSTVPAAQTPRAPVRGALEAPVGVRP
jgi:hypothetical protein